MLVCQVQGPRFSPLDHRKMTYLDFFLYLIEHIKGDLNPAVQCDPSMGRASTLVSPERYDLTCSWDFQLSVCL